MGIYYLFICIVIIFCAFELVQNVELKRQMFTLLICICIIFFGGRYECDRDYNNYVQMFVDTPGLMTDSWEKFQIYYVSSQVEFGFLLSCSILKSLGGSPQTIFFLCSFLTFFFIGKSFWKLSKFPFLSLFIFSTQFFGQPFMQMRFGVAMALVLWAFYHWFCESKKLYWVFWVLGLSFHFVSLAGLIPPILSLIRWNIGRVIALTIFSIFLIFLPINGILSWCVLLIGVDRYLYMYFNEASHRYITLFLLLLAVTPFVLWRKRLPINDNIYNLSLCLALGSILLAPLANSVEIFSRFYMLLSVAYCLIMPTLLFILKRNFANYSIGFTFLMLYGLQRFYVNLSSMSPYQFQLF